MLVFLTAMEGEAKALAERLSALETYSAYGVDFYEGNYRGQKTAVVRSGVGKVHSAHATLLAIERYRPEGIIDTGVAGGLNVSKPLETVAASAFCQHDMDTSPLGDPKGYLTVLDKVILPTDEGLNIRIRAALPEAKWGVIASGDQFIASDVRAKEIHETFGAIACEMEGGAAAQIAALHGVPFAAVRVISDPGASGAEHTYEEVVERAKSLAAELMCRILSADRNQNE